MNALINPPVPEWEALTYDERNEIEKAWEYSSCPHSCGGDPLAVYDAIREVLQQRERRIFRATMDGPPDYHFDPSLQPPGATGGAG